MLINPDQDFKAKAKKAFQHHKIVDFYSKCPLCGSVVYRVREILYTDREDFKKYRDHLVRLWKMSQMGQFSLKCGILCCKCYKNMYGIEEEDIDIERYMKL